MCANRRPSKRVLFPSAEEGSRRGSQIKRFQQLFASDCMNKRQSESDSAKSSSQHFAQDVAPIKLNDCLRLASTFHRCFPGFHVSPFWYLGVESMTAHSPDHISITGTQRIHMASASSVKPPNPPFWDCDVDPFRSMHAIAGFRVWVSRV